MGSLLSPTGTVVKTFIALGLFGAVLNLAGKGKLGTPLQNTAKYITNGYGV